MKSIFARPTDDDRWQWDIDINIEEPVKDECAAFISRLFREHEHLEDYLDVQVNNGLNYIINPAFSTHMFVLYDPDVPLKSRLDCLASFEDLFSGYLAKHCSASLSHLDQQPCNAVNHVCYMWWDVIPLFAHPDHSDKRLLDEPVLELQQRILSIDSIACQESALHGLGHWQCKYPNRVDAIIEEYMRKSSLPEELATYASAARVGCVN
ncbi:MAG: hypothetical protein JST89_05755 [Cyanobacteria bacterium SZAS-4]|nr:hypothetical protein [Cyanobacteria bacterium SZAS-4]